MSASSTTNNMPRDFWVHIGEEVKKIKHLVQPCLRGWLKESTNGKSKSHMAPLPRG